MCPPASETECGDPNLTGVARAIKYHRRLQHFYAGRGDGKNDLRQGAYLALKMAQRLLQGGIPAAVYPGESPLLLVFPQKRYIGIRVAEAGELADRRVSRALADLAEQVAVGTLDGAMVASPEFFPLGAFNAFLEAPLRARGGFLVVHPDLFRRFPRLALEAARLLEPGEVEVLEKFGRLSGRWRKAEAQGYALRLAKHLLSSLAAGNLARYSGLDASEAALAGILAEAGPAGITGRTLGRFWRLLESGAPAGEPGGGAGTFEEAIEGALERLKAAGFPLITAEGGQGKALNQGEATSQGKTIYRLE